MKFFHFRIAQHDRQRAHDHHVCLLDFNCNAAARLNVELASAFINENGVETADTSVDVGLFEGHLVAEDPAIHLIFIAYFLLGLHTIRFFSAHIQLVQRIVAKFNCWKEKWDFLSQVDF